MTREMFRLCRIGVWLAASLVVPAAAAAEERDAQEPLADRSLEELLALEVDSVVGAAKHEQRVTEAPSSVTIVTARDIKAFGWRTLADVLQGVRGFYVTYDRNYSYVGVRGFGRPTDYNNRLLVLIDGHRVNDSIYDGALIGTELPLDLALVDRIEVIRGPGSALYGTSAFFGVINVITKRGAAVQGEAALEAGSYETYRGRVSYGWGDGQSRDVLLSITQLGSAGPDALYFPEFDAPETNHGWAYGLDGDRATTAYAAATLGRWRLQTLFGTRDKHVPTASWATVFNDGRFETTDARMWAGVSYERPVGPASLTARAYYDRYDYAGAYPYAYDTDVVVADDGARMDTIGGDLMMRRRLGARHHVTVGVEQRSHLRQDQWYAEEGIFQVDSRESSTEAALFVQDELTLGRKWSAVLGARYDWWSHKGGTGRPRLGLVYRTDYDTAVKVLYGEAYRAPNMYELYYYYASATAAIDRRGRLRPESLRTSEIVFEQYLAGRVRLAATAYYTWIRDLIDQSETPDGDIYHVNAESADTRGVELEAEGRWSSGILVRGSFALQDAHDSQTGGTLSNAPHHLATVQISVPAWQHQLRFSSDNTYTSWRQTATGERLDGYVLTNLTATYEPLRSRLTLGVSLYNLFDTTYAHPVGLEFTQPAIQQNGRTFAVRAGMRF